MAQTPEELEAAKKEQQRKRDLAEKERKEAELALNSPDANTRAVLRYVMKLSGFHSNPAVCVGPDGELKHNSLEYNVGRESLYHDLRKGMSAETKNAIERSE